MISQEGRYPGIISQDRRWILYPGLCWIPAQYRNFTAFAFQDSKICFGFETGMVLLLEMCNVTTDLQNE